jgi:Rrf2 family protein
MGMLQRALPTTGFIQSAEAVELHMQILAQRDLLLVVAVVDIALHPDTPVSLTDLCERLSISNSSLEEDLPHLQRAGILISKRGVSGGYILARRPHSVYVADILRARRPRQPTQQIAPKSLVSQISANLNQPFAEMSIADLLSSLKQ